MNYRCNRSFQVFPVVRKRFPNMWYSICIILDASNEKKEKKLDDKIDKFQRRLLRNVLKIIIATGYQMKNSIPSNEADDLVVNIY